MRSYQSIVYPSRMYSTSIWHLRCTPSSLVAALPFESETRPRFNFPVMAALIVLLLLPFLARCAIVVNSTCSFGNNHVQIIGFMAIRDEELLRNPFAVPSSPLFTRCTFLLVYAVLPTSIHIQFHHGPLILVRN